jgi:glycosyltransferase involved in cell wall biosynthesis
LFEKVSIVMPAYNEARHIVGNMRETIATMNELGVPFEIILVDDGSQDRTCEEAVRHLNGMGRNVKVARYRENAGKGNALMCGFNFATGDIIAFLDADMDLHPRQLPALFEVMQSRGADVVIGSKRHPRSDVNYPFVRKIWSSGYAFLVGLLFGLPLRDTQTGLKVFRAEVLRSVFPRILAKRFAFDVEVLVVAHHFGYKICDAPVTLRFKRGSFGRVNLTDVWNVFIDTLAIFYRMRLLRYYDRPLVQMPAFPLHEVDVFLGVSEPTGEPVASGSAGQRAPRG